ncbi:FkbM family methyltransferase [Methylobacterium terricola]|uniref:FkbM family methyltransferase n=1 Tax=Methylobacterium terricola TaxID=2583531 RepID=A0A5C4LHP9_9HYPH|nr:FkbM family methyltransferase [Methylobacterium terricola]TNC12321.1 FkbM family methyltransferase [Methylobacterium terricola]
MKIADEIVANWSSILQTGNKNEHDGIYDYIRSNANQEGFQDIPLRITYFIHKSKDLQSFLRVSENFLSYPEFWDWCLKDLAYNVSVYCKSPARAIPHLGAAHRAGKLSGEMMLFSAVQHARVGDGDLALGLIAEASSKFPGLASEARIHEQFVRLVARFPYKKSLHMLEEIKNIFSSASISDVEKEINRALDTGTPYLLLRLGDGEGSCTIVDDSDEAEYHEYYRANRIEFADIWFKDTSIIDNPEFIEAIRLFNAAIPAADCLGGIYADAIEHEYGIGSRRGIAWVVNTMRKVLLLSENDPSWAARTSVHSLVLHYDLVLSGTLARLLRGRGKIGLISCHDDLPEALRRTYGISEVEHFKVPGEQSHRAALGDRAVEGAHWPHRFRELCAELDQPIDRRGQLFLVAAGILGKIYAHKLKRSGAVVLDIGAVADLWMRKNTRTFPDLPAELAMKPKFPPINLVDVGGLGGIGAEWQPYIESILPVVFEPNPPEAAAIRERMAGIQGTSVVERALSNRSERRTLNVTKSLGCTSLLKPNDSLLWRYSIEPAFRITHTVEVDCVRYDSLVGRGEVPLPDAIKIDVQGFEYEVLEGFGDTLFNCLGIKVESHLYPIYEGQKLLHDIVRLLRPFGLALRKITSVDHFDGDVVEVDAWFTCDAARAAALDPERAAKLAFIETAWELPPHRRIFGADQFA